MLSAPNSYSGGSSIDPQRSVRRINGILTWKNSRQAVDAGRQASTGGVVGTGTLVVDFETEQFADGLPVKGDRFELPEAKVAQLVEVIRAVPDESGRTMVYCSVVE